MKLTFFLCLFAFLQVSASSLAQKISLYKNKATLKETLDEIRVQSGYNIFYDATLIKDAHRVSVHLQNVPLEEALKKCLAGQNLNFVIKQNTIIITPLADKVEQSQQRVKISGLVVDDKKEPLIGVTVRVKGTNIGAVTGMDGRYTIDVPTQNSTLVFTYLGFATQEIRADRAVIDVTLMPDASVLNEVVAIGYQTIKRKDLTGASASVSGKDLSTVPVTTAAQALTGRAAGVNVVTQSGAPGAPVNVIIRGGTSITQSSEPLYIVDGFQMPDALRNVDINDIESIDVMKDASATAIYGARGSNGVILITTKSAKSGKTQVSFNSYMGVERLGKKLPTLNALDYAKYQYEFQVLGGNEGRWASYFGGDIAAPDFYNQAYNRINNEYGSRSTIDWQDAVFGGSASTQNHNLNINGGTEKTRFMLSYNNTSQNGIIDKFGYAKNGVRLKLNHELFKGVRADVNTHFLDSKLEGGGSLGGALKMTILQPATGGIRYTDAQLTGADVSNDMLAVDSQYDIYNPIITNDAVTDVDKLRQLVANAGLEFDFTKNLKFRSAGSYQWRQRREDYWDDGRTRTAQNNLGPYGSRNNSEGFNWQITNTLDWGRDFSGHQLNALLGQETVYSENLNLNNSYFEFPRNNFGLDNVSMASNNKNTYGSGRGRSGIVSFFGRGSYSYKGRYTANFTLRADGSSKFSEGNRWGYFPSVAAAWRISDEKFMSGQKVINNLKLRFGYGTSGNNNIGDNMYATDYGADSYAIGDANFPTLVPSDILGNPRVSWEKIISSNLGLDVDVFNSRLSMAIDLYNNESNDLLIRNRIASSTGYNYQFQNIGAIRNRGVELVLNSNNIRSKDVKWNTSFNIGFNRSKVLSIYGQDDEDFFYQNYESRVDYLVQVGKPLGQMYGYKYDGVYTTDDFIQNTDGTYKLKDGVPRAKSNSNGTNVKPGDVKYVPTAGETDSKGNPVWSTNDRTVIGNAQPKFQGGFTNTFGYKGFDLSVFMNFTVGNDIFNMSSQRFIGPYLPNQNTLQVMNNRFILVDPATGRETTSLARLAELNPQQYDKKAMWSLHADNRIAITDALDYYVEDGSFLRIGTVTLGYTLPKSLSQRAKINNARVYFTLNNLHTFTSYSGYDPEVAANASLLTMGVDNSAYPRAKTVVFGLNLTL
ncbi:TonB-dependent receptor [Pedobacter sp. SYSU D00535]|uniref:TonB-dependent receptor n=1 Tax=Pedobacter sp. SYSU D00535 TaxID=2810308 RepID=UPI001A96F18E|nr:TonB-dependent receptor [Pedobacter sp. SYSU D00535]